jgi:Uma2 family endonuclease
MDAPVLEAPPVALKDKISFEDYLKQYADYEGARTEWLAGEVGIYPMSNNAQHNEIFSFLSALLRLFVGMHKIGRLITAGIPMKWSDDQPAREPDLMILLNDHIDRLKSTYVDGIADIVVEIVSPESDERDHGKKFLEYEAAGVPEYWRLDPIRSLAVIFALGEDGRYRPLPLDEQGRLVSRVLPGFALDPSILWQDHLPDGMELFTLAQAMTA